MGHSYQLKLPPHIKIHDVLHANRLKKALINPLPNHEKALKPPVTIKRQEKWEVRGIVTSQIYKNKLQYKTDWKEYDANKAFYNAKGFKGCPYKLHKFHRNNTNAARLPKRLEK